MIWVMAALFIASLIMAAKSVPKVEGAKPAGIEDFNFPTAAERPIQVVFGTCEVKGANVLWYGDLSTRPIVNKVKSLFNTTKTVTGHRYYMGVQMGITHGPDVILRKIKFGDDIAWSGTSLGQQDYTLSGQSDSGIIDINKPELFGGDSGNGGVSGRVRFYNGSRNQATNSYLKSVLGDGRVSALRSMSYVVLEKCYIGNSPAPAAVSFEVSRYSPGPEFELGSVYGYASIYAQVGPGGVDANPAYVIHEILTSNRFGAAIPRSFIDEQSFIDAAVKFFNEGLGVSLAIDSATSAGDVINNILQITQTAMYQDKSTGKLKLKLIRNDYELDDLFRINDSNIVNVNDYTKGSLDSAASEVKITYRSREFQYRDRTAIAQNTGVRMHKGDVDTRTFSMPAISRAEVAAQVAQRELVALSGQLATCSVECNRSAAEVEVGDVVLMSWMPQKIERIAMRVTEVGLGEAGSKAVTLKLVQDIFGVHASIYTTGSERAWSKPLGLPDNVTNYLAVEAPAILANNQSTRSILIAAANPSNCLGYTLAVQGTGDSGYIQNADQMFTPLLTLKNSLQANSYYQTDLQLLGSFDGLDSYSPQEMRLGLGLAIIDSTAGVEWICYQTVNSVLGTVSGIQRGLFGTTPLAHPAGSKIWIVSEGFGLSANDYALNDKVAIKMLTKTNKGQLSLADATVRSFTIAGANERAWAPGAVYANGNLGNVITGMARLAWKRRDGQEPRIVFYADGTSQVTTSTYTVKVKSNGVVIKTVTGLSTESWDFTDEQSLNGGAYFKALTFEISAQKAGFGESLPVVISITR